MTDTTAEQEALRKELVRAIQAIDAPARLIEVDWDLGEAALDELAPYVIADAVLPVVASLIAERDAALADLSALRVAVGQLADELEAEAAFRPETSYGDGIVKTKRNAARRLRSLLDDKENN